jgi:hypothetical protein
MLVRARVTTADNEAGQGLLYLMRRPTGGASVSAALEADRTLGGKVDTLKVEGPSGFSQFPAQDREGNLMGCTWTVTVYP